MHRYFKSSFLKKGYLIIEKRGETRLCEPLATSGKPEKVPKPAQKGMIIKTKKYEKKYFFIFNQYQTKLFIWLLAMRMADVYAQALSCFM